MDNSPEPCQTLVPKKKITDEERLALASKLDNDLDSFINGLEKKAYTDGWSEDNWEEEMAKHPFFMTEFPENPADVSPLMQGIQDLKYDENVNSPLELAQSYKEDGNFNFKYKKYRMAVISYTEGIRKKCGDPETEAALYNNRAASQFFLKNYRSSLMDCRQCLKINPNHDKSHLRAIQCCLELKKPDDALELCNSFLKRTPNHEQAKTFLASAKKQMKQIERDRRKSNKKDETQEEEITSLLNAIKSRGVKYDVSGDVHEQLLGMHERPKLQPDGSLTWPVFFLYPEYSTSDFVQEFHEDVRLFDMLGDITRETADWDTRGEYRVENLSAYYECDDRSQLHRIDTTACLSKILSRKDFIARDFRPAFLVFVRDSAAESGFLKNYTVL